MIRAPGFPEDAVRDRARRGPAAIFPVSPSAPYGTTAFGQLPELPRDEIDRLRLIAPILSEARLAKLIELGREPYHSDVDVRTSVGGFTSPLPLYVSALGSTNAAHRLGESIARQAGRAGIPLVIGENVRAVHGYSRRLTPHSASFKERVAAYGKALPDGMGGLVIQQSVEDANLELWNEVYSDPDFESIVATGRLGFELKLGQGAKPGLGGLTYVAEEDRSRLDGAYRVEDLGDGSVLRSSAPGTFTAEILSNQVRLMKNNYPRARVWVKFHPGRDLGLAAQAAKQAGADAVVVDGAEGGSGLAPIAFLQHVGLSLMDCMRALQGTGHTLVSGRVFEATRLVKLKALGADACGLGRAALVAVDEDPDAGLLRLLAALELEVKMVVSALGKYHWGAVGLEDVGGIH